MHRETGVCCAAAFALGLALPAVAEEPERSGWAGSVLLAQFEETEVTEQTGRDGQLTSTRLEEVIVEAQKPLSSASADVIRAKDYELRPHDTLMEVLNNTPGLVVSQHQGGGKAPQYFLRGFDSDHGTDFALLFDGLPINLPSNAHGQGYADVNFIIPETIDRLQLYKGPYFAQLGDFASAGALNFVTRDEFPENFAYAMGGSFDTQRYVLGASPRLDWVKGLAAAQIYYSNGPFDDPLNYLSYTGFLKFTVNPTPESRLTLSSALYAADWDASGQVPVRAVDAGFIYTNPTALVPDPGVQPFNRFSSIDPSEGGRTDRETINLVYTYTPTAEDNWYFQAYASHYSLELFSNFTFFQDTGLRFSRMGNEINDNRGMQDPDPTLDYVPGDGIEQSEDRWLWGGLASYTRYWFLGDLPVQSETALHTRSDYVNGLSLFRQVQRTRFFPVNRVDVQVASVGGYTAHQILAGDYVRFEAGVRGDQYFFDVGNRLQPGALNPGADPNFDAVFINGNDSSGIVSPKANLVVSARPDTDVYLNFGTGFHSNDARGVVLTKTNPDLAGDPVSALARSIGSEFGIRTRQFDRLDLATALWLLDLESELVFTGDAGDIELSESGVYAPSGATRRYGVDFEARYQATDWLFLDYDLSWAHPRFRNGDFIPLAPTLLQNAGITTSFANGFSAALRFVSLGNRPANEDGSLTAQGYTLVNLLGKYRWRNVELELAFLNITDTQWREAQFAYTSCLLGEVGSEGCPETPGKMPGEGPEDILFTPGNPFAVRGGVSIYF